MSSEYLNHSYPTPSIDYVNQLSKRHNTNNLDELVKAELNELEKSGIVGKFIKYKFRKN